jgi:hypothetical protein
MRRETGELLRDYETEHFLQLAFVNLFPYGRGGPEPRGAFKISTPYLRHLLCLGCQREFQQSPNFIFYAYSWQMKTKSSTISYLATKNGQEDTSDPVNITVADAKRFIDHIEANRNRMRSTGYGISGSVHSAESLITETQMQLLANRLQPYTDLVPGTEMYMKSMRKNLLAMISSPVTNRNAMWAYFYTEAQADTYLAELYDNALCSDRHSTLRVPWHAPLSARQCNSDMLNRRERLEILRDHPLLSARLHAAQQTVFWKYVINGKARPFGKVMDWWRRVEFQEKGTPHSHNLINIATTEGGINEDSLLNNENAIDYNIKRQMVLDAVRNVSTARLQPRHASDFSDLPEDNPEGAAHIVSREGAYAYVFDRNTLADATHPCRQRFIATGRDFSFNKETGKIFDKDLQKWYRRLQLHNQMHVCRASCHKYCRSYEQKICRYEFPRSKRQTGSENCAVMSRGRDRRGRLRTRIDPPRNNANLNVCAASPLMFCGSRGNQDIQYLATKSGGAEYVSKYASKTDTAECKALLNVVSRKLAQATLRLGVDQPLTLRSKLRSVAMAMLTAHQIGSVHACYVLALPSSLVQSSRSTIHVNACQRKLITALPLQLDPTVLRSMDPEASAIVDNARTQLGRRDAYYAFYVYHKNKFGACKIDFFGFLSAYRTSTETKVRGAKSIIKEGLKSALIVDNDGFIQNPISFTLGLVSVAYLFLIKFMNYYIITGAVRSFEENSCHFSHTTHSFHRDRRASLLCHSLAAH